MNQGLDDSNQFLTSDEVARLLRIPMSTLLKMTSARKIPHIKMGRKLLFEKSEIVQWLRTHKITVDE